VAAGGAAMALAAVSDKKGGHVVDDIGCPVLLRDGGHTNTNSAGTSVVSPPRGVLCCSVETFTDSLVVIIVIVIITLPLGLSAFEQKGCESSHSKNSLGLNPLKPP
jgi:hypothetical protein